MSAVVVARSDAPVELSRIARVRDSTGRLSPAAMMVIPPML